MGNDIIDFDEILVDDTEEFDDGVFDDDIEPLTPQVMRPAGAMTSSPFPMRQALEFIEDPSKLFDFSTTKLTVQQQMYILQYAVRGTKLGAAQGAGVPYSVVEKWNKDEEFTEALERAFEMSRDALESEFLRRAMTGSDKLMIEAIRANKPEKYGRRESKDVNIRGTVVHTWSELAMQAKELEGTTETKADVVEVDFEEVENEKSE